MELLRSPTDRSAWGITARKESCCYRTRLCHGLWKKRGLEKSKNRLSHPAWKSRNVRGIPTFPQPRLRLKFKNRTDRVLRKADILICYEQGRFLVFEIGEQRRHNYWEFQRAKRVLV